MAHHGDDLLGELGEADGRGSGNQAFAAPNEKFGVEFISEIVKLQTDSAGGQVNFFRGASHARRIHNREEKLELVNVHQLHLFTRALYLGARTPESVARGLRIRVE